MRVRAIGAARWRDGPSAFTRCASVALERFWLWGHLCHAPTSRVVSRTYTSREGEGSEGRRAAAVTAIFLNAAASMRVCSEGRDTAASCGAVAHRCVISDAAANSTRQFWEL